MDRFHHIQPAMDGRLNAALLSKVDRVRRWHMDDRGIELVCGLTTAFSTESPSDLQSLNDIAYYAPTHRLHEIGQESGVDAVRLRYRWVTPTVVRITVTPADDSLGYPSGLFVTEPQELFPIATAERSDVITMQTATGKLVVDTTTGTFSVRDIRTGQGLQETRNTHSAYFGYISPPLGYAQLEGNRYIQQSFAMTRHEGFYGFGEQFTDFDKRGLVTDIWNVDPANTESFLSYLNVPFFLSTNGYGVLLNASRKSRFDMGSRTTAAWHVMVQGDSLDYYILLGQDFSAILRQYHQLTGQPTVPPRWSFGLWMSKLGSYNTQDKVLAAARRFRDRNWPVSVLHVDPPWLADSTTLVCTYEWSQAFPDPVSLLSDLDRLGLHLSLWICPYVPVGCALYDEGLGLGFFVHDGEGKTIVNMGPMNWWSKPFVYIDFTNPAASAWYQEKLRAILTVGRIVLKTDLGELGPEDAVYHNGMDGLEGHNYYPLAYHRVVFEATQTVQGSESMIWCRSGYIGSQRYPVHWAGDVRCDYDNMAAQLRAVLGAGMSGFPFFSHDIGGFVGTPSPDLFARWFQWGMFSSHARIHGGGPREPWDFPEEVEAICRKFLDLRQRLVPHIYSAALDAPESGVPLVEALIMEYPQDPMVRCLDDEYLFCGEFLVAPMFQAEGTRKIYLPQGTWIEYFTGQSHAGNQWIEGYYGLDQLPLFVKAGAIVLQGKSEESPEAYVLEVFPAQAGERSFWLAPDHPATVRYRMQGEVMAIQWQGFSQDPQIVIRSTQSAIAWTRWEDDPPLR